MDLTLLKFNESDVPVNYQWSGYSKSSVEFKEYNFLKIESEGKNVYICSYENAVALGDYLSNYIFNEECICEVELILSPICEYWFFQAWERVETHFEDLDKWCQNLINYLISKGYIASVSVESSQYFVFSDLVDYEHAPLPDEVIEETEKICEAALLNHFEEYYGNSIDECDDESVLGDSGEWALQIWEKYKKQCEGK